MSTRPSTVFLGITGASGSPYALHLLRALAGLGCSLSVCLSDTGVDVVRHELEIAAAGRDEVTRRLLDMAEADAAVYLPGDLGAPPSSGSAVPDAVVVCPCSLSTAAGIALGTTATLIQRVGMVALKERRPLVLVPRETPLSSIHLRRLLEASEAGAIIVPPMPAFYNRPKTLQEAVDHIVGKVLAVLGFPNHLYPPWGAEQGRRDATTRAGD